MTLATRALKIASATPALSAGPAQAPSDAARKVAKGAGLAEATEEETLVALGEVSPLAVKSTAAAPAEMARTVEKPRPQAAPASVVDKIAMTPRKIGKAAGGSDDLKKIEAPVAMAPDVPTAVAPVTEETVAKVEPTVEAPKPAEKVEQTMPAATPEPAPAPVVAAVAPKPAGIDAVTVSSVVGGHEAEVQRCFADGKKKNGNLKGTLSLQLQVDAGGKVHRVQIQSTLKDPLVAACVVKSANRWQFPARAGGEAATVSYPFSIN